MDPWSDLTSLSYAQVKALQDRKLRYFINRHVYPFSPHYRKLFDDNNIDPRHIRGTADLKHIPFTSKLDLISKENPQKFRDFVLAPDQEKMRRFWPKSELLKLAALSLCKGKEHVQDRLGREYRPVFMTFTTGTTNSPVPFIYSRADIGNLNLSGSRMVRLFNIAPDERIMNIFPFAPHLAFWQVFFGALESGVFSLSTGGGKVLGTEGNLVALSRIKPSVVLGVPSYVYHLVRVAQEKGQDLSCIKKIVLGAARVDLAYKTKLSGMLARQGAKDVFIFGTYGFTEARSAWAECPAPHDVSSGYHLYPDKEIFEIVDPQTGEVKAEDQDGELVYTALDARASVVLRYRTGDMVTGGMTYGVCPYCRRTTLRLSSDITRLSDNKDLQLSKVKGALVNLSHFGSVISDIPYVEEWQIEIRKHNNDPYDVDEVVVYITPKAGQDTSALADDVKSKLVASAEISPNEVKIIPLAEMVKRLELETANKEKRIVDIRPKA